MEVVPHPKRLALLTTPHPTVRVKVQGRMQYIIKDDEVFLSAADVVDLINGKNPGAYDYPVVYYQRGQADALNSMAQELSRIKLWCLQADESSRKEVSSKIPPSKERTDGSSALRSVREGSAGREVAHVERGVVKTRDNDFHPGS